MSIANQMTRWGIGVAVMMCCANGTVSATGWNVSLVDIMEGDGPNGIALQGSTVYVGFGGLLSVIDVSTSSNPVKIANFQIEDAIQAIDVSASHAYLMDRDGGVWILDISTPSAPALAASIPGVNGSQAGHDVTVHGGYLYSCRGDDGLFVYDVASPSAPVEVGHFPSANAREVVVQNDVAYLANFSDGVRIIDVSDKTAPSEIGFYDRAQWVVVGIDVAGDYAYATSIFYDDGLWVIDVSDPANPTDVGYVFLDGYPSNVDVDGGLAYLPTLYDLSVVDVSAPNTPAVIGSEPLAAGYDLAVDGNLVCTSSQTEPEMIVSDVSTPSAPSRVGAYRALGYYLDVAAAGDYVALARAYGLTLMETAEPSNQADAWVWHYDDETYDVDVQGGYAYLGNCDSWYQYIQGLRIVDISDRANPTQVGYLDGYCIYELAVDGDYVFFTDAGTFRTIDVSDPEVPVEVGSAAMPYWSSDIDATGGYAYLAARDDGLRIVDVSTPSSPVEVGSWTGNWDVWGVAASGEYALLAGEEYGSPIGFRILDVSNPAAPMEMDSVETNGAAYYVTVAGQRAYVAGSQNDRVHIIDFSTPSSPVEVGYYETGGIFAPVAVTSNRIYAKSYLHGGLYVLETDLISAAGEGPTPGPTLSQNYPNPFNPSTTIEFRLAERSPVSLRVYDIAGKLVRTLVVGERYAAGVTHALEWDGRDNAGARVASGVYFYRLTSGDFMHTRKMVLLK